VGSIIADWLRRPGALRRVALANVVTTVGIVITGGAVRLTGSGLGCPTWPRCTQGSYLTTPQLGVHGLIENGNRMLTGVLAIVAAAGVLAALAQRPRRPRVVRLAVLVLLGIPAQALLGGLTVLTELNPWLVAGHFLLSVAVIAVAFAFWVATGEGDGTPQPLVPASLRGLTGFLVGVAVAVLTVGTVVTGSGPHAGDERVRRTGLDPGAVAQLHADLVFLLIGASVALWFALRAVAAPAPLRRAAAVLIGVELAQGAVGFIQYALHLPVLAVLLHLAGACAVWLATLAVWFATRIRAARADRPVVLRGQPAASVVNAGGA
jgi:cytochrome c oxidase assembly protein subunit 15